MNIETLKTAIEVAQALGDDKVKIEQDGKPKHQMLGKRCLIRTYSAGVHIGDVVYANEMETRLENSLRLWKWEKSGLSLSSIAIDGIKGGRLEKSGEIYLTNVIEFIITTIEAEKTYAKFIEN